MPGGRPFGRSYKPAILPDVKERVRQNVRAIRRRLRWSQQTAADRCNLAINHYREIEGGRAGLSIRTLCCLAEGFEVDPHELLVPLPDDPADDASEQ